MNESLWRVALFGGRERRVMPMPHAGRAGGDTDSKKNELALFYRSSLIKERGEGGRGKEVTYHRA